MPLNKYAAVPALPAEASSSGQLPKVQKPGGGGGGGAIVGQLKKLRIIAPQKLAHTAAETIAIKS